MFLFPGGSTVSSNLIIVQGVVFDGSTDYITNASQSTDSNTWTMSMFFKLVETGSTKPFWSCDAGVSGELQYESGFFNDNRTGSLAWESTTFSEHSNWHWMALSFNAGTGYWYIDATEVTASEGWDSRTANFTPSSAQSIGGRSNGTRLTAIEIAEFYLHTSTSIDFSVQANRELFRDSDGKPVDLGDDGSTPTSSQPFNYLSVRDGEAASAFLVDRGTSGNWTDQATLTLASDSPSD